jgi:hypothetical protein
MSRGMRLDYLPAVKLSFKLSTKTDNLATHKVRYGKWNKGISGIPVVKTTIMWIQAETTRTKVLGMMVEKVETTTLQS